MTSDLEVQRPFDGELFEEYAPAANAYDEMFSGPGEVRPHWQKFLERLRGVATSDWSRRWTHAQEEFREYGLQQANDGETGRARPWELDVLPLVIDTSDWKQLAQGLVQRAKLLNAVLRDVYGSQELLRSGLLPPEWLYSHKGFHRPFHGRQQADGAPYLQFYAADVVRAPDGRWWIAGDRTDAPIGLGYALQNRIASSRMLPHAIRDCRVERLAQFFIGMRQTLTRLAPRHRENPRIVLLSHGPDGPNYSEDAYLARYLGYTLVEGSDLAVRDDNVYLKTLSGLLPVDVILRHLSDEYCDPLEIQSGYRAGIPGVLEAWRLGNVAIANGLGTSLVESPSLAPFLPGIAQNLLNQELELPSIATWWCGQPKALEQVRGHKQKLKFRSAFRVAGHDAAAIDEILAEDPAAIDRLLESQPRDIAAQELIQRSTCPVWTGGEVHQWHVAMRVFLVANEDDYQVMPGGLVRVAPDSSSLDSTIGSGKMSKDAWVLSAAPVEPVSLLHTSQQPVILRRSGAEVPSRVADSLFWFGRLIERAQGSCRLLRPVVHRLTGEQDLDDSLELQALIYCLAGQGQLEPGFALKTMKAVLPKIGQVLPAAVLDLSQANSLRSIVRQSHANASMVRDRMSLDSWRIIHRIQRTMSDAAKISPFELLELDELLDEIVVDLAGLDGLIGESMTRTHAWRFLDLGRRLERALYVVLLVRSALTTSPQGESRVLEAVLEVADSLMTYRGRYLAAVHVATTFDLLLTDSTNPRSLVYQLEAIHKHVAELPRGDQHPLGTPEDRIASSLLHSLRMLDVEDLSPRGNNAHERSKLGRLLLRVSEQLPKLSDLVTHRYLIHAGHPRQLAGDGSQAR